MPKLKGGYVYFGLTIGSKVNMNCGVNGTLSPDGVASIYVLDTNFDFTSYIKKVCFNVHGVRTVTVEMFGEYSDNIYNKVWKLVNWFLKSRNI